MAKSHEHIPIQLVNIHCLQHHQFHPPFIFHIYNIIYICVYMYIYMYICYLHSRCSSLMLVKSPPNSRWLSILHHEFSHLINPLSQVFIVIPHASYGSIPPSTSASYLHSCAKRLPCLERLRKLRARIQAEDRGIVWDGFIAFLWEHL